MDEPFKPELTDAQWQQIGSLIQPPSSGRGRPRANDRKTLNGILYVLYTGCSWEDVPHEYGSPGTCWRRLRDWDGNGTWERIWRELLRSFDERARAGWTQAFLNGNFIPAKRGTPSFRRRSRAEAAPQ
jgi:transposase